jgi:hypothetical protein
MPIEFNSQSVAAWLNELPLVNLDYSGDALLTMLQALNGLKSPSCADRFGMIERLRCTTYMLSRQGAERQLQDPAFPLSGPLQRHADRGWRLPLELGKGYRLVAVSGDFPTHPNLDRELRALVIYRALEAYGESLLRLSEGYRAAQTGFWRDVYGLYQLAEALQLEKIRVGHEQSFGGATILDRFTQIVLFALCGSHRHRPGKMQVIYELLGAFANTAQIHSTPQLNGQGALFFLELGTDVPPRHVRDLRGRPAVSRRFVFTHILMPALLKHCEDPRNRRLKSGVADKPSLKRVLKALGALERRRFPRIADRGECSLLIGLDRLVGVLSKASASQEAAVSEDSIVQYKGIRWLKVPSYSLQKPEHGDSARSRSGERIPRNEFAIANALHERGAAMAPDEIWGQRNVTVPSSRTQTVGLSGRLINSSASGYCMLWTKNAMPGAKVGELVGLMLNDASFHLGVIRWLHQDADLMFGVELLSPKAEVVEIRFSGEQGGGRMALFLPPNAGLQQPAALVVEPSCHECDEVLVKGGPGLAKTYRLGRLLESTPSFQRFSLI